MIFGYRSNKIYLYPPDVPNLIHSREPAKCAEALSKFQNLLAMLPGRRAAALKKSKLFRTVPGILGRFRVVHLRTDRAGARAWPVHESEIYFLCLLCPTGCHHCRAHDVIQSKPVEDGSRLQVLSFQLRLYEKAISFLWCRFISFFNFFVRLFQFFLRLSKIFPVQISDFHFFRAA